VEKGKYLLIGEVLKDAVAANTGTITFLPQQSFSIVNRTQKTVWRGFYW